MRATARSRRFSARTHNAALRAGATEALSLEDSLTAELVPVLEEAADVAARNFERLALDHSTLTSAICAHDWLITSPDMNERREVSALCRLCRAHEYVAYELLAPLRQSFVAAGDVTAASTMVAVKPRSEEAEYLQHDIDPAELHVTLAYLGETEGSLAAVERLLRLVAAEHAPLEGTVGGHGRFGDNGKGHPGIYLPSVPGLLELRLAVAERLAEAGVDYGREYGWVPHLTVLYDETGTLLPGIEGVGAPLHFDDLLLVRGDETVATIPLSGGRPLTADAVVLDGPLTEVSPGVWGPIDAAVEWVRSFGTVAETETGRRVADVAERHRPDGGYGETAWNEHTRTVLWIPADWTTDDEVDQAETDFLDVDGVEYVEVAESEASLEPYSESDDWEVVWVSSAQKADAVTAAATALPGYCLASELRGKTDPVRVKAVEATMTPALEKAGLAFDPVNPFAEKALSRAASHVTAISQTTQLDVMKVIRRAHEEGLTIPQTARAIRASISGSSGYRARMIARTELGAAASGGSLAATRIVEKETGVTLYKQWLATPDELTRETHADADGQTVPLDAPFDVGGASLDYPGDPDGPPEETIQCRCTIAYTEDAGELTASSWDWPSLMPARLLGRELAQIRAYLLAAGEGLAGWSSPAPDEILPVRCEAPGAATSIVRPTTSAINLPPNAEAAAEQFMEGVRQTEEIAGKMPDPEKLAEGVKHWKRMIARDGLFSEDALAAVRAADDYNRLSDVYTRGVASHGQDAALVIKDSTPADSLLSPGRDAAAAMRLTGNRVTVLREGVLIEKRVGAIVSGDLSSIQRGGLEAVLRHEYGHQIEEALMAEEKAAFRRSLPDAQAVRDDLTHYASTGLDVGNGQEAFCELFAVVSDPEYDPALWPAWVRELGRRYFDAPLAT